MFKLPVWITFALALLVGVSCKPFVPTFYRIDIRQGNYLDQEKVDKLQPGMSKRQVQILMGTPLLADPFRADRWDYVYRFERNGKLKTNRAVSLFFEGELLSRVEDSKAPP